ncbi:MAG: molybdopterin molybdotransferase MoeA [Hyphomicrobiaceae bacterium]|nr:molybdopterin molybdotransferase MoeA [Hyphomicrobiaceae bacterium]
MTGKLLDDCFAHDDRRLTHAEALAILEARLRPVVESERVPVAAAAGRLIAEAAIARRPVPAHTNSAVDGYAFAQGHYDRRTGARLPVRGRAAAGHPLVGPAETGTAVRIFTGAVLPAGVDSVVMQEDVRLEGDAPAQFAVIPPGLKPGANVRKAGEDVAEGTTVIEAGSLLRPQDLAALASLGYAEIACFKALRVAIVSSGDEVVRTGMPLQPGQVYDANAPMLAALVTGLGAQCIDLGVLPDDLGAVKACLSRAAREFDLIITTGGASKGEEDHLVAAVDGLGKRHLWQLAIKPGRPMSFGQIGDCAIVGLPGNPVAVFVCFLLYVRPLLRRLGGGAWIGHPRRFLLPARFEVLDRKRGRREFWRGILKETPEGPGVEKFARDGSGLITGLRMADGLIDIPEDVPEVRQGDLVAFVPYSEFGILV